MSAASAAASAPPLPPAADAAMRRVEEAAGDRLVEPGCGYAIEAHESGALVLRGDGKPAVQKPPVDIVNLSSEGGGNVVILGSAAQAPKMRQIRLEGSGNVVFLGPNAYIAGLDVTIAGSGNLIYFGAFSTAGQVDVRIVADGKTVRVGDFCMISNRVTLGLDEAFGLFDLASGQAIPRAGDVLVDDRVWLGRDVVLANGVHVEPDCVVGQGTVAQGRLRAGCVYGGAPATVLREGIAWSRTKDGSVAELHASRRHAWHTKLVNGIRTRIDALRSEGAA